MSWDAFLLRTKGPVDPDNPWAAEEVPLGSRKLVLDVIKSVFPDLQQESASEFLHTNGDLSIQFKLMGRGPIDQVSLEVRGDGDPITPLLQLATSNGWLIFDVSSSEYIDPKKPSRSGYGGYRKMLKQITGPKSAGQTRAAATSKTRVKPKSKSRKPTRRK